MKAKELEQDSPTLAQGLDANVEQRLKDFFTQYETSYGTEGSPEQSLRRVLKAAGYRMRKSRELQLGSF